MVFFLGGWRRSRSRELLLFQTNHCSAAGAAIKWAFKQPAVRAGREPSRAGRVFSCFVAPCVGVAALLSRCPPANQSVQLRAALAGRGGLGRVGVAGGCEPAVLSRQNHGQGERPPERLLSSFCERDLALRRFGIFRIGSLL